MLTIESAKNIEVQIFKYNYGIQCFINVHFLNCK